MRTCSPPSGGGNRSVAPIFLLFFPAPKPPLNSLPLEELNCHEGFARKNAPMLKRMKTLKTINGKPAAAF